MLKSRVLDELHPTFLHPLILPFYHRYVIDHNAVAHSPPRDCRSTGQTLRGTLCLYRDYVHRICCLELHPVSTFPGTILDEKCGMDLFYPNINSVYRTSNPNIIFQIEKLTGINDTNSTFLLS